MSQRNGAPPCPQVKRLREIVDELAEADTLVVETYINQEQHRKPLNDNVYKDLLNALDWLADHLDNRRLYHKKIQLKNKITRSLLREKLGDDMIDINEQAEKLSRTALADHVAEEE